MHSSTESQGHASSPQVSFVMPCFNEESVVEFTIPKLVSAFDNAGYRLQLIAVDNGSTDRTGELLDKLSEANPMVIKHRVERNEGYGNGVLCGFPLCSAPYVGIIPADGQVDAQDVVQLYEAVVAAQHAVVGKVRRRFRMDGLQRKIVSVGYNFFFRLLWPRLSTVDVNGTPKIMPRDVLDAMNLRSKEWFLDPEILIKAHYLGVPILEFNVFARMRSSGLSHVNLGSCWEFFWKLLYFRLSGTLLREVQRAYKKQEKAVSA